MTDPNLLAGSECSDFIPAIEAIVRRSCIVDFGIIQNIVADGVVEVSVAVSDTPQNLYYMTCVLANTAGSSLTVNVKPNVGDRVLVVYPRIYDENMFTVPDSDTEKTKIIVNPQARGYNLMSGIAILLNQFKTASHKNYIEVNKGKVKAKLAYDKQSNKNLVELDIDDKGEITVTNTKATVKIDKDGNVEVNAQGKYTIKNTTTDLLSVISDLNSILKGLQTEGSSSAQTISPATVTQLINWENSELKALLST